MKKQLIVACVATTVAASVMGAAFATTAYADQPWHSYQKSKIVVPNTKSYQKASQWESMLFDVWQSDETGLTPTIKSVSSNKKVATVKNYTTEDYGNANFYTKAPGKTTITTTISYNGEDHVYKTDLTVFKWQNPVSKLTIGKKDYKKKFAKDLLTYTGAFKKSKLTVKAASGWKLTKIKYNSPMKNIENKTVKNGSKIAFSGMSDNLKITFKSKKTGYTETLSLQAYQIAG